MSSENNHEPEVHEHHAAGPMGPQAGATSARQAVTDSVDWVRLGASLAHAGFFARLFAISVAASVGASTLIHLWRWLRRPPGA
jgi:hypothetical protein